jgi:diaminopimelate epimerase
MRYGMNSPVEIHTSGGEIMKVYFERSGERFSNLVLEGSATVVFKSKVLYDETSNSIIDFERGQGTL